MAEKKEVKVSLVELLRFGSQSDMESFLGGVPPQNINDDDGTTLLHLACKYNNPEIIKFLIERGCGVNVANSSGMTPLMFAVKFNKLDATQLLLDNKASMLVANSEGKSALGMLRDVSASRARIALLNCFLKRMKQVGTEAGDIARILRRANCSLSDVACTHDSQVTRAFLELKPVCPTDSQQSVRRAMLALKMQQVRTLLTHGPFFKKRRMYFLKCMLGMVSESGAATTRTLEAYARQILHWNVLSRNDVVLIEHMLKRTSEANLRVLLRSGIVRHVKRCSGRNVFVQLFANPNAAVIEQVRRAKFDVNARGFEGRTGLHVAVRHELPGNVRFLLDLGADPNVKDDDGESPMFEALWAIKNPKLSTQCVELLLLHGADLQACDHGGVSFVYYAARKYEMTSLLELVLSHLALREANGFPMDLWIRDQIDMRERSRALFRDCMDKIRESKCRRILPDISVFSIITCNTPRRINMAECRIIASYFSAERNRRNFYDNIVKHRMEKMLELNDLRCKARSTIADSIGALRSFDLVIDKIVGYLTYNDLMMFQ